MTNMAEERYYSIKEVAKMLKVAYLTVYRWIQSNRIEAYKIGKQYRISSDAINRFIESSKYSNGNKNNFTFIDLFSGIGGFRIALERLGGTCMGFSEIDKTAIKVYKDNFDTTREIEIGDITKAKRLPMADILVGGVPCQSWSIAGKNKGFDDPRGKLWLDTILSTKKIRPKAFIYENVKGLADPRNKENLSLILNEFEKIGYNTYFKVLNTFDYGLPQNRERIFIVGIRKDLDKGKFSFPSRNTHLPYLASILETQKNDFPLVKSTVRSTNGFMLASKINKGNFFIFSDVRNGDYTIHSWDLINTTKREKEICITILRNRRKAKYGEKDGNPMSYEHIAELLNNLKKKELKTLVNKNILVEKNSKYEFVNSKISSGIDGVYRIFLPESHVFSALTKTGSRDYVAEISIPIQTKDRNRYLIEKIFKPKKYRGVSLKEATKIQSFPNNFMFNTTHGKAMGLLGNAVAVDIAESVGNNLIVEALG